MSYINSSFISSFVNEKFVGVIFALASIVSIFVILLVDKVFRKVGGYRFLLWIIGLDTLSVLLFAFSKTSLQAIVLFVSIFTLNILISFSLDELLKIESKNSTTGKIRGSYIALCNIAWIITQVSLGTFLGGHSFKIIYLYSSILMLLFFIISYLRLSKIPDPQYDKKNTKKYIGEFFKNKNIFRAYGLSLLLQFFYSWMVIYTPIYLSIHLGFTWKEIGIIFAVMLLPFVFIPFHLGKYADKIGERKILMYGFGISSIATLSLFFIHAHLVWLWAMLLFLTRVGASSIEVMSDVYFFKHIKPENEEYVGVYRSAAPVAYVIGPLSAFFVFLFIPSFNFIYLILSALMLVGIYLSSTIKKSDI